MKCLTPNIAYRCGTKICKDGIISCDLKFSFAEAVKYYLRIVGSRLVAEKMAQENEQSMPCGKCKACLIRKRKDMSVRLSHERKMFEDACFITLTYDKEHLPRAFMGNWKSNKDEEDFVKRSEFLRGCDWGDPTLLPYDVQKFIKRLRRYLEYLPKSAKLRKHRDYVKHPIRYFCVGEYGTKGKRPHYHLIIFGWKPSDLTFWQDRVSYQVFRSSQVEKLWTYGFSTVGDVNHGVAKYCAQYVTKKITTAKTLSENQCPEFFLQSVRNGGMGATWLDKYYRNLEQGLLTVRSGDFIFQCSVPRYYLDRLRKIKPQMWLDLRDERIQFAKLHDKKTDIKYYDELRRSCDKFLYEEKQKEYNAVL